MILNYIWTGFFIIAFIVALFRLAIFYFRNELANLGSQIGFQFGEIDIFEKLFLAMIDMAEYSVMHIALPLAGIMVLWLGIMKIGENGGVVSILSKIVAPFFSRIFPEVPKDHPANGAMMMNFAANMLGLDNAATPLGLKAMDELQKLNQTKDIASNAQIMFIVLNTSGLTLIPISVIAVRAIEGSAMPSDVFIPILLTTFCSTLIGLAVTSLYQKINLLQRFILIPILILCMFIALILQLATSLSDTQLELYSSIIGNFALISIVISFIVLGLRKKINVYESFIEGAKDGFPVVIKIIPYLVAMLVGIAIFRASGALDLLLEGVRLVVGLFTTEKDFVDALPVAFMKPLSGSGARGAMIEAMKVHGPDSFVGHLASTFQGSTETTFYTLAVYFGAVNIRNTRYAAAAGLMADFAGIVAAIFISYIFFH